MSDLFFASPDLATPPPIAAPSSPYFTCISPSFAGVAPVGLLSSPGELASSDSDETLRAGSDDSDVGEWSAVPWRRPVPMRWSDRRARVRAELLLAGRKLDERTLELADAAPEPGRGRRVMITMPELPTATEASATMACFSSPAASPPAPVPSERPPAADAEPDKSLPGWTRCDKSDRPGLRQKVWACPWPECNTTWPDRAHALTHWRKHTGEKPFRCSLCGRRFSQRNNMRRHLKRCRVPATSDDLYP